MNYYFIKNILKKTTVRFFIISVLVTGVVWGVFFAQKMNGDVLTFSKNGDAARQTYPCFVQLGKNMQNGIKDGADIFITNGSNSIHSDGLEWYLPYRLFAWMGAVMNQSMAMFGLFYALHMFFCMYYSQKLCHRYFGMRYSCTFLVALSVSLSALQSSWFTSFYVIFSLTLPLIYFSIKAQKTSNIVELLLSSMVYVMAFNSGYSVISCFLAATIFIFTIVYSVFDDISMWKKTVIRSLVPALIGCIISFLGLLYTYLQMKGYGGTSLFDALNYDTQISLFPHFLFLSYNDTPVEGGGYTLSIFWLFVLVSSFFCSVKKHELFRNRILLNGVLLTSLIVIFASMGQGFPVGKWFYEIPVFGVMHLRHRYLLVLFPLVYLMLGCSLDTISKKCNREDLTVPALITIGLTVLIVLIYKDGFNKDYIVFEIFLNFLAIMLILVVGRIALKSVILAASCLTLFFSNSFYNIQEVGLYASTFTDRSVVYNKGIQAGIDNYVATMHPQKLYKYICLDSTGVVPIFMMNNMGWYHLQNKDYCNYLRYPLHGGAITHDYSDAIKCSWFNDFDWEYLFDTRADWLAFSNAAYEEKQDFYKEQVVDDSKEIRYITNDYFLVSAKKYIPRHYTGGVRVLDENSDHCFDNGYFYCPSLVEDDVESFETDKARYFSLSFHTDEACEVQYSMAPVSEYTYYLDGEKVTPVFDYGLMYFSVEPGNHKIEIIYNNPMYNAIRIIYETYYFVVIVGIICISVYGFIKMKKNGKKK